MTPASQRRSISLLAIVALVVTTLASGLARAPAHAASFVDPVLGVVTLCTPSATVTNTDGLPAGQTPLPEHCPLCTLLAPLALAPSLAITPVTFRDGREADNGLRILALPAARLHLGGVGSRAPPPSA